MKIGRYLLVDVGTEGEKKGGSRDSGIFHHIAQTTPRTRLTPKVACSLIWARSSKLPSLVLIGSLVCALRGRENGPFPFKRYMTYNTSIALPSME